MSQLNITQLFKYHSEILIMIMYYNIQSLNQGSLEVEDKLDWCFAKCAIQILIASKVWNAIRLIDT